MSEITYGLSEGVSAPNLQTVVDEFKAAGLTPQIEDDPETGCWISFEGKESAILVSDPKDKITFLTVEFCIEDDLDLIDLVARAMGKFGFVDIF